MKTARRYHRPKPGEQKPPETASTILEKYLLANDLKPATIGWYRRTISVLRKWYDGDIPAADITADLLNQFLFDKQQDGRSAYYRKGLRSALRALFGDHLGGRKLRTVRLTPLEPSAWTFAEVKRIIQCCGTAFDYRPDKRDYWRTMIEFGWHTGLSQCDLHRLTLAHISTDGTVRIRRAKTGMESITSIPAHLIAKLPKTTRAIFPPYASLEQMRRDFVRIVREAKLTGTFKKLRKSSGTEAELRSGKGNTHLANGRAVFEQHYLDKSRIHHHPVKLRGFEPKAVSP